MLSGVSRSKHFPGWGHATFHKASLSFFRSHDVICFPLSLSKYLLPPATKLGQGYVFTGVCDSVHRGVSASVHAGIHTPPGSRQPPPGADTPRANPTGAGIPPEHAGRYDQRAGGTHPTGMQSCLEQHFTIPISSYFSFPI